MERKIIPLLLEWFEKEGRAFPWRRTPSEYEIFVAELLLRKTRAETVAEHFPSIMGLAGSFEELQKLKPSKLREALKPLGLVKRGDWLVENAREIQESHGGFLPRDPAELDSLKGVGEYTRDALLCFAFDEPVVPIDTNVRRVVKRLEGRDLDDKKIKALLEGCASKSNARKLSFALIDLGAKVCEAKAPKCEKCPLQSLCAFGSKVERGS